MKKLISYIMEFVLGIFEVLYRNIVVILIALTIGWTTGQCVTYKYKIDYLESKVLLQQEILEELIKSLLLIQGLELEKEKVKTDTLELTI